MNVGYREVGIPEQTRQRLIAKKSSVNRAPLLPGCRPMASRGYCCSNRQENGHAPTVTEPLPSGES